MRSWFVRRRCGKGSMLRRGCTDPVWLAEELPGLGKPLTSADSACCCPARPVVRVIMPPAEGRPDPVDLLLCGHHYRVSRAALRAAGAIVYDESGVPVIAEPSARPATREHAAA